MDTADVPGDRDNKPDETETRIVKSEILPSHPGVQIHLEKLEEAHIHIWEEFYSIIHGEEANHAPEHLTFANPLTLLRYLKARNFDLAAAKKMIENTFEWRSENIPADINEMEHPVDTNKNGQTYILGYDKHKRPILYMRTGRETRDNPSDKKVKNLIFWLEKASQYTKELETGVYSCLFLVDHKGYSLLAMDPRTDSTVASIFLNHYPERNGEMVFIDSPWLFWGAYKMITPFLPEETKKKITYISKARSEPHYPQLLERCDQDVLESVYGGENPFDWLKLQNHYWDVIASETGSCLHALTREIINISHKVLGSAPDDTDVDDSDSTKPSKS